MFYSMIFPSFAVNICKTVCPILLAQRGMVFSCNYSPIPYMQAMSPEKGSKMLNRGYLSVSEGTPG